MFKYSKTIRKDQILIVEGYMDDCFKKAGFSNVVASLELLLLFLQQLLRRYVREVVLIYDSDEAGIQPQALFLFYNHVSTKVLKIRTTRS